MNSYAYITNPETGRKVNVFGKAGQQIIKNYYIQAGGAGQPGIGAQFDQGVSKLQQNWAQGAPARAKAMEDTKKAMANATQATKNAWGNAQKATGAFFGNVKQEAQWKMLQGTWAGNDALWKKMTPQERCYLSSIQANDCQENPYFDARVSEIVTHLQTAHQVLTQYYTMKAQFDKEDTALSMKPVSAPGTPAEKKKVQLLRDQINKLPPIYKTSVSRAESKLRRLPQDKFELIKEQAQTMFESYPVEVSGRTWSMDLDPTLKMIKLTAPEKVLAKVVCKPNGCVSGKKYGLFGGKNRKPLPGKIRGGRRSPKYKDYSKPKGDCTSRMRQLGSC